MRDKASLFTNKKLITGGPGAQDIDFKEKHIIVFRKEVEILRTPTAAAIVPADFFFVLIIRSNRTRTGITSDLDSDISNATFTYIDHIPIVIIVPIFVQCAFDTKSQSELVGLRYLVIGFYFRSVRRKGKKNCTLACDVPICCRWGCRVLYSWGGGLPRFNCSGVWCLVALARKAE